MMPVGHLSHSSRETLLRCAKSWQLKYLTPAPRRPALWSAGGSAVHEVTEAYDRAVFADPATDPPPEAVDLMWSIAFDAQIEKIRKIDPNEWNWGRSASEPIEVWRVQGLEFVRSYVAWRQRSPYTIWTTPDGVPAIELDVSGMLPGCPVEIKGYVDRIFHDPVFDRLIILDLKTGKRPPKSADQFSTYAALVAAKWPGTVPALGVPFMNRKATLGTPWDLAGVLPESVGAVFSEAWEQIQAGEFPAEGIAKGDCFVCDMSASCYAKGGPLAHLYDPDDPSREAVPF